MPSAPKHSDGARLAISLSMQFEAGSQPERSAETPFPPRLRHALSMATALAGIAAVSVCLAEPGQTPVDRLVAAKPTVSTAATKPEVVSALTLPRPAHDITISRDGRIFMMMADAPWLVEWVNGELSAYPDARWNDPKAPDHSHALVRPNSLVSGRTGCCG
jgi:hypothetical protein